jgi:hypothetical protein
MRDIMKASMMVFAVVAVAAAVALGARPETQVRGQAQRAEDEARLAAALSGMTAGPAQDCVTEHDLGSNESYGSRTILFHGPTDDVVYVNRLAAACPGLDSGLALEVRTPAVRLCRGDIATVFDPVSGSEFGGCSLGKFTPYHRTGAPTIK